MQERHATSVCCSNASCIGGVHVDFEEEISVSRRAHTCAVLQDLITCVMRSDPILPIGIARACV
jgi:hypothetical protein